jgi:hypothetical protein
MTTGSTQPQHQPASPLFNKKISTTTPPPQFISPVSLTYLPYSNWSNHPSAIWNQSPCSKSGQSPTKKSWILSHYYKIRTYIHKCRSTTRQRVWPTIIPALYGILSNVTGYSYSHLRRWYLNPHHGQWSSCCLAASSNGPPSNSKLIKTGRMKANETKSTHVTFTTRRATCPPVHINDVQLPQSNNVKYLGLHLDRRLTWHKHIFH